VTIRYNGIVTADDRSGNFYKQIVIQDSTAGLTVLIDNNSLFNEYPVGRKIYIKLKGLYMSKYAATPQLGYLPDATGSISNIPGSLVGIFYCKSKLPEYGCSRDSNFNAINEYGNL